MKGMKLWNVPVKNAAIPGPREQKTRPLAHDASGMIGKKTATAAGGERRNDEATHAPGKKNSWPDIPGAGHVGGFRVLPTESRGAWQHNRNRLLRLWIRQISQCQRIARRAGPMDFRQTIMFVKNNMAEPLEIVRPFYFFKNKLTNRKK